MHVIGYRRVSTEEQARNGHGLDAQRQTIEEHAARKGWTAECLPRPDRGLQTSPRPSAQAPALPWRSPAPHPILGFVGVPESELEALPLHFTTGADSPRLIG
jgi:hypothetical protein